jgi:uncharacterized Zn-binding protein involved in type VI secretion
MMRRTLVVGDPPICGGRVLSYVGSLTSTIHGHQVALIGGRAYCEGCNSVGIIAKAGGPRRAVFVSEVALDGDVVMCQCPRPQPIVSTLQSTSCCDDLWQGAEGESLPNDVTVLPLLEDHAQNIGMKRLVDDGVTHAPDAERTENICPNMTNKEFCTLVLDLRDKAVSLIEKKRLPELERWGKSDQSRVKDWFGVADQPMREYLKTGLADCVRVLRSLGCKNFVRFSETALKNVGCILPSNADDAAAAVCKPDIRTHTIAINLKFCELRPLSADEDSMLSTLIHEVTHFDDCFSSLDTLYYLRSSLAAAKTAPEKMKTNADSIAGYVVWGEVFFAN